MGFRGLSATEKTRKITPKTAQMAHPAEFGDLPPELFDAILSRVPLKSRARFKKVCEAWRSQITQLPRPIPPPTSAGLVLFLRRAAPADPTLLRYETTVLCPRNESGECALYSSSEQRFPSLVDSCNGLLLFSGRDVAEDSNGYYVYSPSSERLIAVPGGHDFTRPACAALFLDSQQFKVICHFWQEVDAHSGTISYQIFSSQSWDWREDQRIVGNSDLLLDSGFHSGQCFLPSLQYKGRLYSIWSLHLLVYDDSEESFELLSLPNKTSEPTYYPAKLLWESEGSLHYCDSHWEGFFIWAYSTDATWWLRHCLRFSELERNMNINQMAEQKTRARVRLGAKLIQPCAFDEDLQILYFRLPEMILAYSFATQSLSKAWTFSSTGDCFRSGKIGIYHFQFCSAGFHIIVICKILKSWTFLLPRITGLHNLQQFVYIRVIDKRTASFYQHCAHCSQAEATIHPGL